MTYGWGNGHGAPEIAKRVARAFYKGRKAGKEGYCHTDGTTYWLFGNAIARRVPDAEIPDNIYAALMGQRSRRPLEFTWAGWPTPTTARHLSALGVNAVVRGRKRPELYLNGKPCYANIWYSPEDIEHLPEEQPKPPRPHPLIPPPVLFVDLTPDLFESCAA
jgi:hypothetical protein